MNSTKKFRILIEEFIFIPFFIVAVGLQTILRLKRRYIAKNFGLNIDKSLGTNISNNGKTIFVLGSGSSINNISGKQWEHIQKNDTIGTNYWILHDFTPSYFLFELEKGQSSRKEYFIQCLSDKKSKIKKIYFNYKYANSVDVEINNIIRGSRNVFFPDYLTIPGYKLKEFQKSLDMFKKFRDIPLLSHQLSYKRSSITIAISICYALGFSNIVLCGVDLINTKYFYESEYYKKKYSGFVNNQVGQVHLSMDEEVHPLTIDKVILSINDQLLKPNGVILSTIDDSPLFEGHLPKYSL